MKTYLTIRFDEKDAAKQAAREAGTYISFDFNKKNGTGRVMRKTFLLY